MPLDVVPNQEFLEFISIQGDKKKSAKFGTNFKFREKLSWYVYRSNVKF